ncbi:Hypothetical protein P9211_06841 [Prochlorococcus marinus str. MIT 9211]|uniref:Uncharacterized protein n=1 Tax=Prochlorococcus marinus (strain MIT 9211) TaxID=93059 RepID=A9B9V3_PROM4|nr:Hypothetical protein P9211_06841 [Prochlorococcus marinus str. MIT 9211]
MDLYKQLCMIENFNLNLITVKFGELDLPNSTVFVLLGISIFVFVAVGLSSFRLIQSAFLEKED